MNEFEKGQKRDDWATEVADCEVGSLSGVVLTVIYCLRFFLF